MHESMGFGTPFFLSCMGLLSHQTCRRSIIFYETFNPFWAFQHFFPFIPVKKNTTSSIVRIIKCIRTNKWAQRRRISEENSLFFPRRIHEKQEFLHPDLLCVLLFDTVHRGLGNTHSQSFKYSFTAKGFQAHKATYSTATKDLED